MMLQDIRQTEEYAKYMQQLGWTVLSISSGTDKALLYAKKLPLLPLSVMKCLRNTKTIDDFKTATLRKKHRAIIYKEEPLIIDKQNNERVYFSVSPKNSWPVTPTKTLWLDLSQPLSAISSHFKAKTRYNLKKASQQLVSEVVSGDKVTSVQMQSFFSLWLTSKLFSWPYKPSFREFESLVNSFNKRCFLIFIHDKGHQDLLGVCLILTSETMAFYWHNASSKLGKSLFAPTLYVWEAIAESKRRGCKVFDFEGVFDERYPNLNQGWKGFTRFKESFCS